MYHLTDIPDSEKINFRTLHHDIGMKKMDNGQWDLWFDNGDLVSATEFHSLQVGIIIACLTSWNYLNRYGNPTYEIFGNESYSLLKRNKREDVRFKIRAYFEECLLRCLNFYLKVFRFLKGHQVFFALKCYPAGFVFRFLKL